MTKRITARVAVGRNGGIHDPRAYKKACQWLENHTFTNAQLWHLVFFGSTNRKDYVAGLDRLCERLRDKGMRVEWRAAFEHDMEKLDPERRFHRHAFLMIEADVHKPIGIINYKTGKDGLSALLARHNLKFYICKPGDDLGIHGGQPYMYVPKKPGVKLDDCTAWIEYLYKVRSKAGVVGTIYSSSRNKTTKPAASPKTDGLNIQVVDSGVSTTTNEDEGNEMVIANLTPAGFTYLAKLYEQAVDQRMDVGAIHAYLTRKGVAVTRAEVIHQLEHVFSFPGYAAANPAKPMMTYEEFEAQMRKPARRLPAAELSQGQDQKIASTDPKKIYQTAC